MNIIKYLIFSLGLIPLISLSGQTNNGNDDLYYVPSKNRINKKDSITVSNIEFPQLLDSLTNRRKKSIHIFPNFIENIYAVNFEYLIKDNKSVLVEGVYWFEPDNFNRYEFLLNYRIHNKSSLNSWFYGFFIGFATAKYDYYNVLLYDIDHVVIDYNKFTIGANIGKKWVFKNGLGIELRVGWGIPFVSSKQKSGIDAGKNSILYEGLDSSLTFGYSF